MSSHLLKFLLSHQQEVLNHVKKLQHADLDAKLLKWLVDSERTGLLANGQDIQDQAKKFAEEMNIQGMIFSEGFERAVSC